MARTYTRVTFVGTRRRVDVVVPSDEPVGRLLPEALRLTGEPIAEPAALRHLALVDGTLLGPDHSLGDAHVPDGAVLRVVGLADAPPAAVVHDVTEEVADDLAGRAWRWDPRARRWTAGAVAILALVLLTRLALGELPEQYRIGASALWSGALLLLGAAVCRVARRAPGAAVVVAGGATAIYAAWVLVDSPAAAAGVSAAALAVTTLALGLTTELGRGGVIGGAVGLLLVLAWAVPLVLDLSGPRTYAVLAVVSAIAVGILPRTALGLSGLATLDDRRTRDEVVTRPAVANALAAAHRSLTLATIATAASAAVAGWLLTLTPNRWTIPLAALLAVVLAVRTRSFPLMLQVIALAAAAGTVTLSLLAAWLRHDPGVVWWVVVILSVVAVLALGVPVVRPPEHSRARARRISDRLEAATVVAMVPVAVGVSGIYGRLLESF